MAASASRHRAKGVSHHSRGYRSAPRLFLGHFLVRDSLIVRPVTNVWLLVDIGTSVMASE
jgi:hypothetical protein